jgi:hypothetical protein
MANDISVELRLQLNGKDRAGQARLEGGPVCKAPGETEFIALPEAE